MIVRLHSFIKQIKLNTAHTQTQIYGLTVLQVTSVSVSTNKTTRSLCGAQTCLWYLTGVHITMLMTQSHVSFTYHDISKPCCKCRCVYLCLLYVSITHNMMLSLDKIKLFSPLTLNKAKSVTVI